jgi:hypothetical protein
MVAVNLRKKQVPGIHIEEFLCGLSRFRGLFDIMAERFAILLMVTRIALATTGRPQSPNRGGSICDGKLNCPARRCTRLNPRALNVVQETRRSAEVTASQPATGTARSDGDRDANSGPNDRFWRTKHLRRTAADGKQVIAWERCRVRGHGPKGDFRVDRRKTKGDCRAPTCQRLVVAHPARTTIVSIGRIDVRNARLRRSCHEARSISGRIGTARDDERKQ